MTELRGRVILITGAASGLGRRMALSLAARGAKLALWDINQAGLDQVASELPQGCEKRTFVCDISKREAVYESAAKVQAELGPVDILINNAGVVSGQDFLEIPDEKIERTFGVNTLALFWLAKAFLPAMVERNSGHIVTIASSAGLIGVRKLSDYSASKYAAVGFNESLRMELAFRAPKVRTTVVCPFFIDTGMFRGVRSRFPFLLPILKEEKVVARIIRAIERDQAELMMPWLVKTIPFFRAFPTAVFDAVANVLGVNVSMNEFIGRAQDKTPE